MDSSAQQQPGWVLFLSKSTELAKEGIGLVGKQIADVRDEAVAAAKRAVGSSKSVEKHSSINTSDPFHSSLNQHQNRHPEEEQLRQLQQQQQQKERQLQQQQQQEERQQHSFGFDNETQSWAIHPSCSLESSGPRVTIVVGYSFNPSLCPNNRCRRCWTTQGGILPLSSNVSTTDDFDDAFLIRSWPRYSPGPSLEQLRNRFPLPLRNWLFRKIKNGFRCVIRCKVNPRSLRHIATHYDADDNIATGMPPLTSCSESNIPIPSYAWLDITDCNEPVPLYTPSLIHLKFTAFGPSGLRRRGLRSGSTTTVEKNFIINNYNTSSCFDSVVEGGTTQSSNELLRREQKHESLSIPESPLLPNAPTSLVITQRRSSVTSSSLPVSPSKPNLSSQHPPSVYEATDTCWSVEPKNPKDSTHHRIASALGPCIVLSPRSYQTSYSKRQVVHREAKDCNVADRFEVLEKSFSVSDGSSHFNNCNLLSQQPSSQKSLLNPLTPFNFAEENNEKGNNEKGNNDPPRDTTSFSENSLTSKVLSFHERQSIESSHAQEELAAASENLKGILDKWAYNDDMTFRDIRTLIGTLSVVLWKDNTWQPISFSDLVIMQPTQLRKVYRAALLFSHPDRYQSAPADVRYRAHRIFHAVNESFQLFKE